MGAVAPGIAAIDHHARAAAPALGVDGRQHDVGAAAGLGQATIVKAPGA